MNIKFISLQLTNFMSYEEANIMFGERGFTLINGINKNEEDNAESNGSGKSTIFDAIVWCLTGTTIRGTKNIKRYSAMPQDNCSVTLQFKADGKDCILRRTKDPSDLNIVIDGKDVSGKGIRDSEKMLKNYLPELTPELLNSVIIIGQGMPMRFTNNTPSGRKDVLEKLAKSDYMFEDIKRRLANRLTEVQNKQQELTVEIAKQETGINLLTNQISSYEQQLTVTDINTLKETLSERTFYKQSLENRLESLKIDLEVQTKAYQAIQSQLETLTERYPKELQELESAKQAEMNPLRDEESRLKAQIASLQRTIRQLKSVVDVCPTCGQKLPNVHKVSTDIQEQELLQLQSDLAKVTESQKQALKIFEHQTESLRGMLDNINSLKRDCKEHEKLVSNVNLSIQTVEREIKPLELTIESINAKLSSYEEQKARIESTIKELSEKLVAEKTKMLYNNTELSNVLKRVEILKKISSLITRDFRGYLLEDIIAYINKRAKEYSIEVFNTEKIEIKLDGNNILISYAGKEYENLSGGERCKCDIIVQLAIRQMLVSYLNFSSNIFVLDEGLDYLDSTGCEKVLNLIYNKLDGVENVYIITHHSNDLPITFDNEITIVKDKEGISHIQ